MFSYNIDELTRQGRKLWNLSISQSRCVNKQLALCPFCGLDLLRNDGGEDTETLRGKALYLSPCIPRDVKKKGILLNVYARDSSFPGGTFAISYILKSQ